MTEEHYNEPDIQPEEEDNGEGAVEIYSKWAIRGFSILSPIFGGALLFINLKNVGYKKAAYNALLASIGYFFLSAIVASLFRLNVGFLPLLINYLGGVFLTEVFFKKHFPDDDYYPRPIWSALAIVIAIQFGIFFALYYSGLLPAEVMKALKQK
ncbi:hypothetical protein [Mucilaginibacter myungsuensis]|uniref:Uncharacterized protein n=1 Tax=Mucilaginibacter myungsuensis TaxID=649104 RepID=A0A929PXG9_9SPHI|nr:hypothetical protein [Mucilaginibacter myungsuensis]MBE9662390.1 hypothetical protein [Mucilaginibacter myungsuensis]MDN3599173.1 hypothetical protein [Mucilaginibacter myungsuensis]